MIRIEKLNKEGLIKYIESEEFIQSPVIAISKHRAESQINNPSLKPADTIMLLAYEEQQLIGYLGTLPDVLYNSNQESIRCGWMSCLWVDPDHRGKKIAQTLTKTCFEEWDDKVLLTEFSPPAGKLYEKIGLFKTMHTSFGRRWYVKSDLQTILPPKNKYFKSIKSGLAIVDSILNTILIAKKRFYKPVLKGLHVEFTLEIDNDVESIISKTKEQQCFQRGKQELTWMLKYPWIVSSPIEGEMSKKYHFSSWEKQFETNGIIIKNKKNNTIAFLIYSLRKGHLKIPYCFSNGHIDEVKRVISWLVETKHVKTVTIFQTSILNDKRNKNFLFSLHKQVIRPYMLSTSLEKYFDFKTPIIHDGDGDCAFT